MSQWISVKDRLPEPNDGKGVYWVAKKKNNGEWQKTIPNIMI